MNDLPTHANVIDSDSIVHSGEASTSRHSTRADRVVSFLKNQSNFRSRIAEVAAALRSMEGSDVHQNTVAATILQSNATRRGQGLPPFFNTHGSGMEQRGYVSLAGQPTIAAQESPQTPIGLETFSADPVSALISEQNESARNDLKNAIRALSWREFESNFLRNILDALGFGDVEITQATRDGGTDARCSYKRGLVSSSAIVSAKHWSSNVAADEVQRLRGIRGNEDTGIIVSSSSFSQLAIEESAPSQNQRSIVLIDIDQIVEICLQQSIGVTRIDVPTYFRFSGFEEDIE